MLRMPRSLTLAARFLTLLSVTAASADEPSARFVPYHGYDRAIELVCDGYRAVLCPQAGGRVLEFSVQGRQALLFIESETEVGQNSSPPMTAGRFDFGPELVVHKHPAIWSGAWSGEITGTCKAKLTSPREAGVQLVREFEFVGRAPPLMISGPPPRLDCRQTIANVGDQPIEVCHWGRSFSPGGGIVLIPLGDRPSRFPSKYAMYEDSAVINVRSQDDKIRERDGFLEILGPPRKPKLGFDSYAGWMAYLMPNDVLFIKTFATFPDRVYNEAAGLTLSVWYPQDRPVIELEPIGPRERLQPGESATFTESWHIAKASFPKNGESVELEAIRSAHRFVTTGTLVGGR